MLSKTSTNSVQHYWLMLIAGMDYSNAVAVVAQMTIAFIDLTIAADWNKDRITMTAITARTLTMMVMTYWDSRNQHLMLLKNQLESAVIEV